MSFLSLIYQLLKGLRLVRRQSMDCVEYECLHGRFGEGLFYAASPHCELQPVRSGISKTRRR
jgi:hypothetical protein